jgi:hypothetical protein
MRLRIGPLFVGLGLAFSGGLVLTYVTSFSAYAIHRLAWSGEPAFVDAAYPQHVWYPPPGTRATQLDALTYLDRVPALRTGDIVARILVRDTSGRELELPLFAGLDTGNETHSAVAPLVKRAEDRSRVFSLLNTRIGRYALTGLATPRLAIGQSFRRSFPLPHPMEVQEIRIDRRHPACRLNVQGLWLGEATRRIAPRPGAIASSAPPSGP